MDEKRNREELVVVASRKELRSVNIENKPLLKVSSTIELVVKETKTDESAMSIEMGLLM